MFAEISVEKAALEYDLSNSMQHIKKLEDMNMATECA